MPNETISKAKEKILTAQQETFKQTLSMLNNAFALIAALAWNEAVRALIDRYFKAGSGLYSKFVYAIILTVIVVVVSRRLHTVAEKFNVAE